MSAPDSCFYCEKDARLMALMVPLRSLGYADAYLLRDQKHPGRCVVAAKRHVKEIYEMSDAERDGFFIDLAAVAKAIADVYSTDKMNYAVFGDLVPHFHVHLVPKKMGGLRWGEPFNESDSKQPASDAQLEEARIKLLAHLH